MKPAVAFRNFAKASINGFRLFVPSFLGFRVVPALLPKDGIAPVGIATPPVVKSHNVTPNSELPLRYVCMCIHTYTCALGTGSFPKGKAPGT